MEYDVWRIAYVVRCTMYDVRCMVYGVWFILYDDGRDCMMVYGDVRWCTLG